MIDCLVVVDDEDDDGASTSGRDRTQREMSASLTLHKPWC